MNTCVAGLPDYLRVLVLYTHLVPIVIAVFLCAYALFKTRASKLAILFSAFGFSTALWLLSDLVAWGVFPDYYVIYFFWSWLDFVNIVFFVFGAYFFSVLARNKVSIWEKIVYVLLCIPAFIMVVTGTSVLEFTQPVCEAVNSDLLTNYKLVAEGVVVVSMLVSLLIAWKKSDFHKRIQLVAVLAAILLFFTVFAGTEYFSSITGIYEINLYSLFVLPVFLIVMVFAVTNLGLFNFRLLGTQILSYILILMSVLQLLLAQDSTHTTLNVVTLGISVVIGLLLLQNAKSEEKVRLEVEQLAQSLAVANKDLETANRGQESLIHAMNHQIKGFITTAKNIFSVLGSNDYGQMPEQSKPLLSHGFEEMNRAVDYVQGILRSNSAHTGALPYDMKPVDLKSIISNLVSEQREVAEKNGLSFESNIAEGDYKTTGDATMLGEAFKNLITNAIKYNNPNGSIKITLSQTNQKILFAIKDTGVGISKDDQLNLFKPGGIGKDSIRHNADASGYGLVFVKPVIEKHNGKIWYETEVGKGTTFFVELPVSQTAK